MMGEYGGTIERSVGRRVGIEERGWRTGKTGSRESRTGRTRWEDD